MISLNNYQTIVLYIYYFCIIIKVIPESTMYTTFTHCLKCFTAHTQPPYIRSNALYPTHTPKNTWAQALSQDSHALLLINNSLSFTTYTIDMFLLIKLLSLPLCHHSLKNHILRFMWPILYTGHIHLNHWTPLNITTDHTIRLWSYIRSTSLKLFCNQTPLH